MSLIGLDIGTSGCKCTIFKPDGAISASSYCGYSVKIYDLGRKYELDPHKVWAAVKKSLYDAMRSHRGEPPVVISVSSFGEAFTPVSKKGEFLYNSILFMDKRGEQEMHSLIDAVGKERLMNLTGVPVHSMYSINKIMWMQNEHPEICEKTWKFMLYEDLVIYMLTGTPVIDHSLASRTMAFNIVEKKWDEEVLDAAGTDHSLFSDTTPSGYIAGKIRKTIADETGLPESLLVVAGAHDQACAALGGGALCSRQAVEGIGTADCITTVFDRTDKIPEMLKYNFASEPYIIPGRYAALSFVISGGSLVNWFIDNFAYSELRIAKKRNESVYKVLDENSSGGPTGLLVLPHFAGSGTPHMDTASKGAITGLSLDTTKAQLYRAVLEGVGYEMRLNIDCLEQTGTKIESIRVVGGGARSDLWMQIRADIYNRVIECPEVAEAGTLANAIIGGVSAGIFKSYEEASGKLVRIRKRYCPDPRTAGIYDEFYRKYINLYGSLREIV